MKTPATTAFLAIALFLGACSGSNSPLDSPLKLRTPLSCSVPPPVQNEDEKAMIEAALTLRGGDHIEDVIAKFNGTGLKIEVESLLPPRGGRAVLVNTSDEEDRPYTYGIALLFGDNSTLDGETGGVPSNLEVFGAKNVPFDHPSLAEKGSSCWWSLESKSE